MIRLSGIPWFNIWAAVMLYGVALVYQGYQYGQGDQSQILPCLYAQDHPGSYPHDHYVNHYLDGKINERTIFHFLFRHLGYDQPWIVWCWHALLSISLIVAWLKISGLGLKNRAYQVIAIALILVPGFHTSTGANEIYYNSVVPSLAAKSLASWGIYYWLTGNNTRWLGLLTLAGYLQPLVGIQLFLVTGLATLMNAMIKRKINELPWQAILVYLFLTVPWIYFLSKYNGGNEDVKGFMAIIEFRLPHHFLASSFRWTHLLAFFFFSLVAIRYYRERLFWFMIIILAGCMVYEVGVEFLQLPVVLYTQWWKTTIWLEAFAIIALVAGIERYFPSPKIISKYAWIWPLFILGLVCLYRLSGIGTRPNYMFPWKSELGDEVEISLKANQLIPENAVFLIPIDFTAFRWYSKRSIYIDYKALFHQEAFLKDWYDRIQKIYAYGMAEKKSGFDLRVFSKTLLEEPSQISIEYWNKLGITHIVSTSAEIKSLPLVTGNDTYSIYSLK